MPNATSRGVSGASKFESATFEAKLHECKFLPSGELRIVLLVPENDSDEGVKLKDAFPVRLHVAIEKRTYGQ
jgi:hypothetical protein